MGRSKKTWRFLKDWNHVNINTGEVTCYKKGHIVTNALKFCCENGISSNFFCMQQYNGLVEEVNLIQMNNIVK